MATLTWVNERWLDGLKRTLSVTAKTIKQRAPDYSVLDSEGEPAYAETGESEPNPAYERIQRQIEAAEYHLATKQRILEKAAVLKFKPNGHDGTCVKTKQAVKAGAGFVRKEGERWATYSRDAVIEILGVSLDGLPEIED